MDSILGSIKKLLGIVEEHDQFDVDLIIHINSVFMILTQLGIGPSEGFTISDSSAVWSDYDTNGASVEGIKTYMYCKIKPIFDPPSNSFTLEALNKQAAEYEWRMSVIVDPPFTDEENQND